MDTKQIAQQFMTEYYGALMGQRQNLINFYTENSVMTYGGDVYKGVKQIAHKIESFGFEKIQYNVADFDVQEGPNQGSLVIFCTGTLQMDNDPQYKFSQVFNLLSNGSGGFYIHNDIFRLVLG
ncbi:hypothetical protein PPERSA_02241 [Pseudocohnilembus persalinus]|uniref:Nuclear transport factor 2 n=1 Tax=Pseudocohnilembus persalinus TaxID=266149 RepID=A0A0V0QKG3_PSEPJ|nr:hypothetical protein PPERSA_02241 [Pseudocohnilembus persalinus]|eukprot:KRX02751.1 hypothetical protein PPERSA_02241 [Pseudocohnilembus persalinus]